MSASHHRQFRCLPVSAPRSRPLWTCATSTGERPSWRRDGRMDCPSAQETKRSDATPPHCRKVDDVVGKQRWMSLMFVALLLAGCGRTTGLHGAPAAQAGTPTPTATLASTPTPSTPGVACSASTAPGSRSGDLIVSVGDAFYIYYRELPATIPLKPLQLPDPNDTAAFDAQIPPLPAVSNQVGGRLSRIHGRYLQCLDDRVSPHRRGQPPDRELHALRGQRQ
jgi:hypothetical protein